MKSLFILLVIVLLLLVLAQRTNPVRRKTHEKITMYGRDTCGYTVKMKKMIDNSNYKSMFDYIEVSNKPHILKELNIDGVPAFEYKNKVIIGAMPVEVLLKKINVTL